MSENGFPDALQPQHQLHWYAIERVLGQGGFGITYLARDPNLDQSVAIKEYLPVEVATRRPDATVAARTEEHRERYRWGLERFIREARTLARFDHPNIVRVLSVFELNNTAYMVMRFEEGETLAALLERRHSLGEADLMRVLLPILGGLELVHNAGFIHRDIKPDNIHIRSDGTPVLLDFGSARDALGHSRTVTILVAPGYAPFEQYYSSGESQGPWTDIYGLGATCYRAIAGRAPLDAIARSKGILGSTQELLVPATAVGSGRYSERLLKAVDHALAFAEKDRPQSIAQWRSELVGESAGVSPSPAKIPAATRSVPAPTASNTRGPLLWGAAGGIAVIVAIAVVPWLASGRRDLARQDAVVVPKTVPAEPAPPAPQKLTEEQIRALIAKGLEEQRGLEARKEEERKAEAHKKELLAKRQEQAPARQATKPRPQPVPKTSTPSPPPPADAPGTPSARATPVEAPAPQAAAIPAAPAPATTAPAVPKAADLLASADRSIARGDYADAVAALKPLADRGNARAMVRLGDLYLAGQGVERSQDQALRMFRAAAELHDSEGQQRLGDMYAKGRGVPQNNFHAYVWYTAAARAGNAAAKVEQERIAATLQAVEVEQAAKLAERLARAAKER